VECSSRVPSVTVAGERMTARRRVCATIYRDATCPARCKTYGGGTERKRRRRSSAYILLLGIHIYIYIIFRYDGIVDLSSAECYDPNCNRWSAVTSLGTKRSCLGISANHGMLYVCGGFDGASCLSSVERYDPLTGVWSSCPSMTTRRRYCRVSVVGKINGLRILRYIYIHYVYFHKMTKIQWPV